MNSEQLGYIRAHLLCFKSGAFTVDLPAEQKTLVGSICLRRLSKDLSKLRARVQRREGYNYNWIVDELTKQEKQAPEVQINLEFEEVDQEESEPVYRQRLSNRLCTDPP